MRLVISANSEDEQTVHTDVQHKTINNDNDNDNNEVEILADAAVTHKRATGGGAKVLTELRTAALQSTSGVGRKRREPEAGQERTLHGRLDRVLNQQASVEPHAAKRIRTSVQRPGQSEDAKRLFGLETVPLDAQPILVPGQYPSDDLRKQVERTSNAKMPGKVAILGFKPMDTLQMTQPFSQRAVSSRNYSDPRQSAFSSQRLSFAGSTGANVGGQRSHAPGGDSFYANERQSKRRKTDTPVDLTGEYEHVLDGEIFELNDKALPANIGFAKQSRPSDSNIAEAMAPVKQYRDATKSKNRRRKRAVPNNWSGAGSSQGSTRDTPSVHEVHPGSYSRPRSAQSSFASEVSTFVPEKRRKLAAQDVIPPINLGEGVDSPNKLQEYTRLEAFSPVRANSCRSTRHNEGTSKFTEKRKERGLAQGRRVLHQDEPSLRRTFERDPEPAAPAKHIKAREKMQVDSMPPEIRVSQISGGSEDELAGANTVLRRGSQSVSPHKQLSPTTRISRSSPSDIERTDFTLRKSHGASKRPSSSQKKVTRVPVLAFYSSSCFLPPGDKMSLCWDARSNSIDLHNDGGAVPVKGKHKAVSLEANDVRKVVCAENVRKIIVHGVKTETSTGRTCITFENFNGVQWFLDHGLWMNEKLFLMAKSAEHVNAAFEKQSKELRDAFNQHHARAHSLLPYTSNAGRLQTADQASDDEEILYEPDEDLAPQVKSSAQRLMQHNHNSGSVDSSRLRSKSSSGPGSEQIKSRFFPDEVSRPARARKATPREPPPPPPEQWTQVHSPKPWAQPVLYPPQGGSNAATVEFNDLKTLDETVFLNDSIIAFALRQIQDKMKPEHREQVHFFNSFFYASLTSKNGKRADCNFDGVRRWTRKADILSKPFIVVPINLHLHWFVAIICNIDQLPRKAASIDDDKIDTDVERHSLHEQLDSAAAGVLQSDGSLDERALMENQIRSMDLETRYDDAGDTPKTAARKKSAKKVAPPPRKYDPSEPIIITLDSLGGTHPAEVRNLKDYIVAEALDKREMTVSRDAIRGMTAKQIPEQTNLCDCGVFLTGYVEQFAKNPRQFVDRTLNRVMEKETDFATFDPSKKRAEIRDELLRLNSDREAARNVQKKQKADAKKTGRTFGKPAASAKVGSLPDKLADHSTKGNESASTPPAGLTEDPSFVEIEQPPPPGVIRSARLATMDGADSSEELEVEPPRAPGPEPQATVEGQQQSGSG